MSPEETLSADGDGDEIRSRLVAAAGKVRHPALVLSSFTTGLAAVSRDEDDDELADADADDSVPEEEREQARLRRAALLVAAFDIVDWCIDDLRASAFGMNGLPDPEDAEESFVYEWFPERHRGAYDEGFFRKVMVTAVKVAADLGDADGGPACCTAEEIVRHAVGSDRRGGCARQAGLGRPWLDPDELLLEDVDFEFLYDADMDGLEDDPGTQAALGVDLQSSPGLVHVRSNSERSVHPYAETPATAPAVHDLRRRLCRRRLSARCPGYPRSWTPRRRWPHSRRAARWSRWRGKRPPTSAATGGLPMTADRERSLRGPGHGCVRRLWQRLAGVGVVRRRGHRPRRPGHLSCSPPAFSGRGRPAVGRCGHRHRTGAGDPAAVRRLLPARSPGAAALGTEGSHGRPRGLRLDSS